MDGQLSEAIIKKYFTIDKLKKFCKYREKSHEKNLVFMCNTCPFSYIKKISNSFHSACMCNEVFEFYLKRSIRQQQQTSRGAIPSYCECFMKYFSKFLKNYGTAEI